MSQNRQDKQKECQSHPTLHPLSSNQEHTANIRFMQGERPAWRKGREEREAPRSGIFLELPNHLQGLVVAYLTIDHLFCSGVRAWYWQSPLKPLNTGPHNGCPCPSQYQQPPCHLLHSPSGPRPFGNHLEVIMKIKLGCGMSKWGKL